MSISAASSSSASLSQLRSVFAQLDGNKSGSVSSDEIGSAASSNSAASSAFTALSELVNGNDANGDGGLGGQEFESAFGKLSSEMQSVLMGLQEDTASAQGPSFDTLDADASGGLSYEEFAAGAPEGLSSDSPALESLFSAIDGDGDGAVSSGEFSAFAETAGAAPPPAASSDSGSSTSSDSSSGSAGAAKGGSGASSSKEVQSESTVTNADGSSTTTTTYTDGSTETSTTPPSPMAAGAEGEQGRPSGDKLLAALSAYAANAATTTGASSVSIAA